MTLEISNPIQLIQFVKDDGKLKRNPSQFFNRIIFLTGTHMSYACSLVMVLIILNNIQMTMPTHEWPILIQCYTITYL